MLILITNYYTHCLTRDTSLQTDIQLSGNNNNNNNMCELLHCEDDLQTSHPARLPFPARTEERVHWKSYNKFTDSISHSPCPVLPDTATVLQTHGPRNINHNQLLFLLITCPAPFPHPPTQHHRLIEWKVVSMREIKKYIVINTIGIITIMYNIMYNRTSQIN